MSIELDEKLMPRSLPHVFALRPLADYFAGKPLSQRACRLIDMPGDVFLDTEDEIHVIAASLWELGVKYDRLPMEERPKTKELERRWITRHKEAVVNKLAHRIEPPFHPFTIDMISKDVAVLLDEILTKTLPVEARDPKVQK